MYRQGAIRQVHQDRWNWKRDWWRLSRWVCRFKGHTVIKRELEASFWVKVNGGEWEKAYKPFHGNYCTRCQTVTYFQLDIQLDDFDEVQTQAIQAYPVIDLPLQELTHEPT